MHLNEAEFILNKWAERQGWNGQSKLAVVLAFIDELGTDAVGRLDRHLATVAGHEAGMAKPPPGMSRPPIEAEVHSDDGVHEVTFDAALWFAQATDDEIRDLAKCGWGGDYPADAVALFFEDSDPGDGAVAELFAYLHHA